MAPIHLDLAGTWDVCPDEATCTSPFHLTDMTVGEVEAIPPPLLLPILNALQPPTDVDEDGYLFWFEAGNCYRAYDLPAVVCPDGSMYWHDPSAALHRAGGRPAVVLAGGQHEWWEHGRRIR